MPKPDLTLAATWAELDARNTDDRYIFRLDSYRYAELIKLQNSNDVL
jgi:hypothetical protein